MILGKMIFILVYILPFQKVPVDAPWELHAYLLCLSQSYRPFSVKKRGEIFLKGECKDKSKLFQPRLFFFYMCPIQNWKTLQILTHVLLRSFVIKILQARLCILVRLCDVPCTSRGVWDIFDVLPPHLGCLINTFIFKVAVLRVIAYSSILYKYLSWASVKHGLLIISLAVLRGA